MQMRIGSRAFASPAALCVFLFAPIAGTVVAQDNEGGEFQTNVTHEFSVGGISRVGERDPVEPDQSDVGSRLVVEHALTRSVRDSAALLDATSLPGPGDSYRVPTPRRAYLQEVDADPGRLRIAFSDKALVPVHRDCVLALHDAATLCRELGHEVAETNPPLDYQLAAQSFTTLWTAGCAATIDGISRRNGKSIGADDVEPLTWALYEKECRSVRTSPAVSAMKPRCSGSPANSNAAVPGRGAGHRRGRRKRRRSVLPAIRA